MRLHSRIWRKGERRVWRQLIFPVNDNHNSRSLLELVFLLSFVVVAYPRRRRGSGNVEIGNIDFQGL
jgi:hypothetical protein